MTDHSVTITVTRSGGKDGAVLIFVDTDFEPDGSDGSPGLRILLNDYDAWVGKAVEHCEPIREAVVKRFTVDTEDIPYLGIGSVLIPKED